MLIENAGGVSTAPPGSFIGPNGMAEAPDGSVWMAQHGDRRIVRVAPDRTLTPVVSTFEGKRFNSPNDLVFARDGALYFTDPPYGLAKQDEDPAKELRFNGVYRFANGRVAGARARPEPAERPGVLARLQGALRQQLRRGEEPGDALRRRRGRHAVGGRVFADLTSKTDGLADGLKVDAKGNVYTTGPGGVWVLSPAGAHLGTIKPPETPANCGWGDDGKTLYMTAITGIYRVKTLVGSDTCHSSDHAGSRRIAPMRAAPGDVPSKTYASRPVSPAYSRAMARTVSPADASARTATVPPLPPPVILAP